MTLINQCLEQFKPRDYSIWLDVMKSFESIGKVLEDKVKKSLKMVDTFGGIGKNYEIYQTFTAVAYFYGIYGLKYRGMS